MEQATQTVRFRDLCLNTKVLLIAFSVLFTMYSTSYVYYHIGGSIAYYYEFFAAAFGDADRRRGCLSIVLEYKYEYRVDKSVDWFHLQKCLGNHFGLMKEDDGWGALTEVGEQLFAPTALPGFFLWIDGAIWICCYVVPWANAVGLKLDGWVMAVLRKDYFAIVTATPALFCLMFSVAFLGFLAYSKLVFFAIAVWTAVFVIAPELRALFNIIAQDGPSGFNSRVKGYQAMFEPVFVQQKIVGVFCLSTFAAYTIWGSSTFALGTGIFLCIGLSYGDKECWIVCHHTVSCACFSKCRHLDMPQCRCFIEKNAEIKNLAGQVKAYRDANDNLRKPQFPASRIAIEHKQLQDEFTNYQMNKEKEVNDLRNTIHQLEARCRKYKASGRRREVNQAQRVKRSADR